MADSIHHEALYRRWRPQTFSAIIGQEHVSRTLANAVAGGRVAHAYLFCGPRGTGKTSTARILAKALNCEKGPTVEPCGKCRSCTEIAEGASLDVVEVDAASYRQVDETQEVLKGVRLAPAGDRRKVYIIDEVHMLSTHSFNALLKTLEEPPEHVIFVLATTEPHRVLPTVLSRCQRFDFHRIPIGLLVEHLKRVSAEEKIKISDEALSLIARRAQGSVRDALGALEQLVGFTGGKKIEASDATRLLGAVELDVLIDFVDQLNSDRAADAFRLVRELSESGRDARSFIAEVVDHLRQLFILQNTGEPGMALSDLVGDDLEKVKEQAGRVRPSRTIAFLEAFGDAYERARGPEARLVLEMTIVKLAKPGMDISLDGILYRLERVEAAMAGGEAIRESSGVQLEPQAESCITKEAKEAVVREIPELAGDEALVKVTQAWDAILERLRKKKPAARACLIESKPISLEGGRLVLEFGPWASFHREKVEGEYAANVIEAVKAIVGIDISLDCQAGKPLKSKADESKMLSIEEVVGFVADEFDAKIVGESTVYSGEPSVLEEDE
ncbi:MAG: DNA polymerase III subunit gamma/tau [Actinobacteria bacterium]|nr:DNA polymerase III subunit gamma/tau [Actinomycetota bacterium]